MQRLNAAAAKAGMKIPDFPLPSNDELRGKAADDDDDMALPQRAWYSSLGVRVVVALLVIFGLMHLFLWKVVYDFWIDQDHDRLNESVRQAWASLERVRQHLVHFGDEPKEEL